MRKMEMIVVSTSLVVVEIKLVNIQKAVRIVPGIQLVIIILLQ